MELEYASHSTHVLPVSDMGDVRLGCQYVKQLVVELGFNELQREQIHIAAKEMSSNMVVHQAIDPSLSIYRVKQGGKTGITLVASDHGPGIPSVANALADRHSSAGSMGCGLGAVRRLMDEFTIHSRVPEQARGQHVSYAAGGTTLVASKWCAGEANPTSSFHWGGVSRPKPGYSDNGDAYFLQETDHEINLMLADGLGHGHEAQLASQTAVTAFRQGISMPLENIILHMHTALRGTRGVALLAVRLDKQNRTLQYAGIGNIDGAILPKQVSGPLSRPGILGSGTLVPPHIKTLPWPDNGMLILHSDGVSRRWGDDPNVTAFSHHPLLLSHLLLRDYGRFNDDAAVLILREDKADV